MSGRYDLRKRRASSALEAYETRRSKRRRLRRKRDDEDDSDEYRPSNEEGESSGGDDLEDLLESPPSPPRKRLRRLRKTSERSSERSSEKSSEKTPEPEESDESDEVHISEEEAEAEGSEESSEEAEGSEAESSEEEVDLEDEENYEEDDEYFALDKSALVGIVTRRIRTMIPDLPQDELKKAVKKAMRKAREDLVEEYCGAEPKDESWKGDLEDEIVKDLEPQLKALRLEMKDDQPTMVKILKAKIPSSDKKRAIQLYDVLKNLEPYTMDYYSTADEIRKILAIEKEIDPSEIPQLEAEEKRLREMIGDHDRSLKTRVLQVDASDEVKARIYEMYMDLMSRDRSDSEYSSLKQKIIWAVNLPHRKIKLPEEVMQNHTPAEVDRYCTAIYEKLEGELYGMKKVKERLIQIVNNRIYNPKTKAMVALKGRPGVGKTAVASALAKSMNLPFERVSLGGMDDPSIFKGTDNSWVGAAPSILLQILRRMKVSNGVVLIDEIDKLGVGGDGGNSRAKMIQYALLHITDYIQNSEFQDTYLSEFPHDLSNIWFMFAMNDDTWLDSTLRDRLDIVEIDKYTSAEITKIIQLHILPKALEDVGLPRESCEITEQACGQLQSLLGPLMRDNGLRPVEKEIHQLVSRLNMLRTQLHDAESTVRLSYSLSDFEGFPYQITTSTVQRLWSNPKIDTTYLNIYI